MFVNNILAKLSRALTAVVVFCTLFCGVSGAAFAACTSDQIDVNGDGSQCETSKFKLTTTFATSLFFFISASGTFYVDCGDGGTLTSAADPTDVSDKTISRTDTTGVEYTCTWDSGGFHTIKFGGTATGYSNSTSDAAISFSKTTASGIVGQDKIYTISGSLATIFPQFGSSNGQFPRFRQTFRNANNLASIPSGLFAGGNLTGGSHMFHGTFFGCYGVNSVPTGLFSSITTAATSMFEYTFANTRFTSIPGNLFSGINTGADYMFENTFYESFLTSVPAGLFSGITTGARGMFEGTFDTCTGLTSVPAGLFSGITTGADYMFEGTFARSGLSSVPSGLFSGITTGANSMFEQTFYACTGLTSVPAGLFSGITTGASSMFEGTFYACTGLTSVPAGLFSGITTGASDMFKQTFYGCTKISGYIPPSTFSGLIANDITKTTNMWANTFYNTKLAKSCAPGTSQYITGYEGTTNGTTWNGYVSCEPCSETPPEHAEYIANSCDWVCNSGYAMNDNVCVLCDGVVYNNTCHTACPVMTTLHAGEYSYPLFADRTNVPSPVLHFKKDGTTCYTYLEADAGGEHGLKVRYNNAVYHAIDPSAQ